MRKSKNGGNDGGNEICVQLRISVTLLRNIAQLA